MSVKPSEEKRVLREVGNCEDTEDKSYLLHNLAWVQPCPRPSARGVIVQWTEH